MNAEHRLEYEEPYMRPSYYQNTEKEQPIHMYTVPDTTKQLTEQRTNTKYKSSDYMPFIVIASALVLELLLLILIAVYVVNTSSNIQGINDKIMDCSLKENFSGYTTVSVKRSLDPGNFELHREKKNWDQAFQFCKSKNQTLAIIYPSMIGELALHNKISVPMWIAGKRISGKFYWQNSSSGINSTEAEVTGSHWNAKEPNNMGGAEDCIEMGHHVRWNDAPCHQESSFVCQRPTINLEY